MMNPRLCYLAGVFDVQGSCAFYVLSDNSACASLRVTSKSHEILQSFKDEFKGNISGKTWTANGKNAEEAAQKLLNTGLMQAARNLLVTWIRARDETRGQRGEEALKLREYWAERVVQARPVNRISAARKPWKEKRK